MEPELPRGDEPDYDNWIDDLDFAAMDCEELEMEEIDYGEEWNDGNE